jgi:AcrR family transcriptional regulator
MYICKKLSPMDTREQIIDIADNLIRHKGYNAFSFYDISKSVGIKTASVHYHFPAKSDLGVAVIEQHIYNLALVREKFKSKSPQENLDKFLSIYSSVKNENAVCLVGSLTTDFNTLDKKVKEKLKTFADAMLDWVSSFLEEGRNSNIFQFKGLARTKALMITGNMLAIVQLSRLTGDKDFKTVKDTIKKELISI